MKKCKEGQDRFSDDIRTCQVELYKSFTLVGRSKTWTEDHQKSFYRTIKLCLELSRKRSIYSSTEIRAAGFEYVGDDETAYCDQCKLQISDWTVDIKPFNRHAQERPDCPFVRSILGNNTSVISTNGTELCVDAEKPSKRQKLTSMAEIIPLNPLVELNMMKTIRQGTFKHWSTHFKPSVGQMVHAGFFSCNVADRVICIYCNLICQQWSSSKYDPFQVHKTLSPRCCFVIAAQKRTAETSVLILNEFPSRNQPQTHLITESPRFDEVVITASCHPAYAQMPRREASFASWPTENLPSVDALVRAGFFYSGTKTIVTCFYCNGSLQNWGAKDDPMIEHARWFPNCAYAKQLCGADLYQRIQESKRALQGLHPS